MAALLEKTGSPERIMLVVVDLESGLIEVEIPGDRPARGVRTRDLTVSETHVWVSATVALAVGSSPAVAGEAHLALTWSVLDLAAGRVVEVAGTAWVDWSVVSGDEREHFRARRRDPFNAARGLVPESAEEPPEAEAAAPSDSRRRRRLLPVPLAQPWLRPLRPSWAGRVPTPRRSVLALR